MTVSLSEVVKAQRAYAAARQTAIQSSSQANADPAQVTRMQQQALLRFLQARTQILADARTRAVEQYDTEIARYQQRIGQLQQMINESANIAPVAAPPPVPAVPALQNKGPVPDKKA